MKNAAIFWIAILLAPLPLLWEYFFALWRYEQYRYFPLVFVALGFLIWDRWDRKLLLPRGKVAIGFLTASLFFYVAGVGLWSPFIAVIGFVFSLGAFLVSHTEVGSKNSLISLWPPVFLLIRLPLNLDQRLVSWLQFRTSGFSSDLLDRMAIPHTLSGNVFELKAGKLFVEEACSGVQSLFTVVFIAFFLVAWQRRSVILLPLYAVFAMVWASVMNTIRVVCIAVCQEWYGLDLSHGWQHQALGYFCLAIGTMLLLSTDRLLRVVFFGLPEDSVRTKNINPLALAWNWFFDATAERKTRSKDSRIALGQSWPMIAAVGSLLLIGSQFWFRPATVYASAEKQVMWDPKEDLFNEDSVELVPGSYERIRGGSDIALGDNADVWQVMTHGVRARLAISQPYNEFHDLCDCYEANGWKLNDRIVLSSGEQWPYIRARFVHDDGRYGTLVFSGMDSAGRPIGPTDAAIGSLLEARITSWKRDISNYRNLMVQLWVVSQVPVTTDELADFEKIHFETRETVRSQLKKN